MKLYLGQYTKWNITDLNGYVPKTTFWNDFDIADWFGISDVKDTFNRAFKEWKNDIVYMTELALVTNHKSWQHQDDTDVSQVYSDCYYTVDNYIFDENSPFTDEDKQYYLNITD